MSPIPDRDIKEDPVVDELISVMNQTRDVPITMPSKRIEGMRLTSHEYDHLIIISRTRPLEGVTFEERLAERMTSTEYLGATPDRKVEMLKFIQHSYDDWARKELEKENPIFAAKLAEHRKRRDELRFGQ